MKEDVIIEIANLYVDDYCGKIYPVCPNCSSYEEIPATFRRRFEIWNCPNCASIIPFEIEWRKNIRKECKGLGFLESGLAAVIKDISLGGMLFGAMADIPIGNKIRLSFVADVLGTTLDITTNLRVISKNGGDYGAKFLDIIRHPEVVCLMKKWNK